MKSHILAEVKPRSPRFPIPWIVTERDFRRYIYRALHACRSGRVIFIQFRRRPAKQPEFVMLSRVPETPGSRTHALAFFRTGRARRVSLQSLAALSSRLAASDAGHTNTVWDPCEAGRQAVEVMKQVGGRPLSREGAAARLRISLVTLYNRIKTKKIVAWTDPAGRYRFPRWQFRATGIMPGIIDCLRLLDTEDQWAVMRFFLTPSEVADDRTPLQLLRDGRIAEAKAVASAAGGCVREPR